MPAECPCGAPALEDGLCGFCLEHSPGMVRTVLRRQRDRIEVLDKALGIAIETLIRMGLFGTTGEIEKVSPEMALRIRERREARRHAG